MRLTITLGFLIITINTMACSCSRVGILKNRKEVDFVFKGRVGEVTEKATIDLDPRTKTEINYVVMTYTFEILRHHKGLRDQQTVQILMGTNDCDVSFEKGKKYLVYGYTANNKLHYRLADQETEPYLTTHLCTRTKKVTALTFWESFVLWLI